MTDPSGPNSATDTDDLTPEVDLVITKDDGVASATPGGSVTYTITRSNPTGPSDVDGATVVDTFPAAVTAAAWTCVSNAAAPRASGSGSGDINETVDLPVGGTVNVQRRRSTSTRPQPACSPTTRRSRLPSGVTETDASDNMANDSDTLTPDVDLSISKTDGQITAVPGDPVTYMIVVSNGGVSDVTGATVDRYGARCAVTGATWTCSADSGGSGCTASGSGSINDTVDVDAGGTLTYTLTGTLSPAATGTLDNTATSMLPGPLVDPTPANNTSTDSDTITPVADLEITKDDGVTSAAPGTTVTYTVVADEQRTVGRHRGHRDRRRARRRHDVHVDLSEWGRSDVCQRCRVRCDLRTRRPSCRECRHFTVTATISPAATGTLDNTATVAVPSGTTDPGPGPNSATDSDVLGPIADLSVTKDDGATTATPGGFTTYTIVVSNAGPSPALDTLVADAIPPGVTALGWTCTPSVGASCDSHQRKRRDQHHRRPPAGVDRNLLGHGRHRSGGDRHARQHGRRHPRPGRQRPRRPGRSHATDSDTLEPSADLSISKTDGATISIPGSADHVHDRCAQRRSVRRHRRPGGRHPSGGALVGDLDVLGDGGVELRRRNRDGRHLHDRRSRRQRRGNLDAHRRHRSNGARDAEQHRGGHPADRHHRPGQRRSTATDTNTLAPTADLSITKTDGRTSAAPLDATTYTIVVSNAGDSAVDQCPCG